VSGASEGRASIALQKACAYVLMPQILIAAQKIQTWLIRAFSRCSHFCEMQINFRVFLPGADPKNKRKTAS
jgi:hypothetical protein